MSFNLIDETWLPCVAIDGELIEVQSSRHVGARARIA